MEIIEKKLLGYSALAAGIIGMNNSNAQIYYTDIEPDTVLEFDGDHFDLDLDGDGIINFQFWKGSWYSASTWWAGDIGYSKNVTVFGNEDNLLAGTYAITGFCESCSSSFLSPYALNEGIVVNSDFDFYIGFDMALIFDNTFAAGGAGNWFPNTIDKYLGIEFTDSYDITHFGWIRCDVVDDYVLKIKDYAYEGLPSTPITTGYTGGCWTPIPIGTAGISPTSAKPKWEPVPSADFYHIQYRVAGTFSWSNKTAEYPKTFKKIGGLSCATNYEWRIRAACTDGDVTEWSAIQTFTTSACRIGDEEVPSMSTAEVYSSDGLLYVNVGESSSDSWNLMLFDQAGRKVFEAFIENEFNVYDLKIPQGIYIAILQNDNSSQTEKIVL